MKPLFPIAALAVAVFCPNAWAQTPEPVAPIAPAHAAPALDTVNPNDDGRLPGDQRIEKLHSADSGSTLDETRIGGQSQGVTVKPANRAPAYQILPNRVNSDVGNGQRVWNVLKF